MIQKSLLAHCGRTAVEQEHYFKSVNLNQGTDFLYLALNIINGNSYPRSPGFQAKVGISTGEYRRND